MELAAIQDAQRRLHGLVERTPLLHSRYLSDAAGGDVWLKAECLQRTGSFKLRGAANMIASLTAEERSRGVITASAGNHGQGVAVAAQMVGAPAVVVMPETASFAKVEAVRGYGAEVVLSGLSYHDAAQTMHHLAAERELTVVPAFDDERIVAGQGTLGLELLEQAPDIDLVVVPVGGGGLAAGVSAAVRELRPACRVIGVQAAAAPGARQAWLTGRTATYPISQTIADGIAIARPGDVTMPLLRKYLDDIVCVDEEAITRAMVALLERARLVVEGAGAVGVAALLRGMVPCQGRRVAVILSGGNIDMNLLGRVVEHGLAGAGRYLVVRVAIDDRPGHLARVLAVIAGAGANVLDVDHRRSGAHLTFGLVEVELLLETRNASHADAVCAALAAHGYAERAAAERRAGVRHFAEAAAS